MSGPLSTDPITRLANEAANRFVDESEHIQLNADEESAERIIRSLRFMAHSIGFEEGYRAADSTPRPWLRAEEVRESGSYWWRSPGCPYSVVVGVMLSGTDGSFFAHKDQQGWLKAQPLIALGGLWQRIPEPELPEEEG